MGGKTLSIFTYDNYREFLKDYYAQAKAENRNFSFRFFARQAGFKSCSVLKEVMDGKINIAPHSIERYARALKLNKEEAQFFRNLVFFNQARTSQEKQIYAEEILKCRSYKKIHPLSSSQFNYYRHWYFIPIRELIGFPGFREDPEWIAAKINPAVSAAEVTKAIEELLRLGLIERTKAGELKLTSTDISTGDEMTSNLAAMFHREMMKKASESIDRHARERRDISALTMGLSEKTMATIKTMIQKFRKDLMNVAAQDHSPNTVYQLNFQFFPLTDSIEGEPHES